MLAFEVKDAISKLRQASTIIRVLDSLSDNEFTALSEELPSEERRELFAMIHKVAHDAFGVKLKLTRINGQKVSK